MLGRAIRPTFHAKQLHHRRRRLYADPDLRRRVDYLVVAAWTDKVRLRQGHYQEPVRSDSVLSLHRRHHLLIKRPIGGFSRRSPQSVAAAGRCKSLSREADTAGVERLA